MTYYGAKEIAGSFRTVRNNTLKIAEEIPEEQYGFRPSGESRTVAQTLIHISNVSRFALEVNRDHVVSTMMGFNFPAFIGPIAATEQTPMTKAEILARLTASGDEFESWVGTLSDEFLAETISMPPGGTPASRTRFELLIAVKEHEMHHRGQLMLVERMLGMTPHMTREAQARRAAMEAAAKN